jgi:hypothetical protein
LRWLDPSQNPADGRKYFRPFPIFTFVSRCDGPSVHGPPTVGFP